MRRSRDRRRPIRDYATERISWELCGLGTADQGRGLLSVRGNSGNGHRSRDAAGITLAGRDAPFARGLVLVLGARVALSMER